jgi:hypothetical protein
VTQTMRENKQENEQLLRSYAERTGFPSDRLNKLRAERQAEQRRLLAIRADAAAQVTDDEEAAFLRGLKGQRDALGLLTTPSSTVVTLNQPVMISSQHTHEGQPFDFESHLEPFNSCTTLGVIDTHSGSDEILVTFEFAWDNPSSSVVVIDIGTMIRLS